MGYLSFETQQEFDRPGWSGAGEGLSSFRLEDYEILFIKFLLSTKKMLCEIE